MAACDYSTIEPHHTAKATVHGCEKRKFHAPQADICSIMLQVLAHKTGNPFLFNSLSKLRQKHIIYFPTLAKKAVLQFITSHNRKKFPNSYAIYKIQQNQEDCKWQNTVFSWRTEAFSFKRRYATIHRAGTDCSGGRRIRRSGRARRASHRAL